MEWFQNKTTQVIALVGIIGTLAGFGYTGATYVNRLENLEAKIGGLGDTKQAQQVIEERFIAIETSVKYINKSIDDGINPSLKNIAETSNETTKTLATLTNDVERLWIEIDDNKNPLSD